MFGQVAAWMHVIEFQKRGLPHAHILLILSSDFKPRTQQIVDQIVSAEIRQLVPNPEMDGERNQNLLRKYVLNHMIHGLCRTDNAESLCMVDGVCSKNIPPGFCDECRRVITNSPCIVDGSCCKKFPKEFSEQPNPHVESYSKYRRRDNGVIDQVRGQTVDNRWVVPYNPYLLLRYNCHINVKVCASIVSVKYLFKYIYKGHDCSYVELQHIDQAGAPVNEIRNFVDARYVSAPEAIWRIFAFQMQRESHTFVRLQIHLPNEHTVVFAHHHEDEALQENESKSDSLIEWFRLNRRDPVAMQYLYTDIPKHYVFRMPKTALENEARIVELATIAAEETKYGYLHVVSLG